LSVVSKNLFLFEFKILTRRKHSLRLFVRYPNNLGIRMVVNHSEQIAHVEMVEVDARDAPLHAFLQQAKIP
jgi:hypothetical protein